MSQWGQHANTGDAKVAKADDAIKAEADNNKADANEAIEALTV
jgi:hypothetical protein